MVEYYNYYSKSIIFIYISVFLASIVDNCIIYVVIKYIDRTIALKVKLLYLIINCYIDFKLLSNAHLHGPLPLTY